MAKYKTIIGRYVFVDFKDQLALDVPAKVDTGAYYSAITASDIKIVKKNGTEVLKCKLFSGHPAYPYTREFETTKFESRSIANSFGHSENRYIVTLKLKIANKVVKTQFGLADRSNNTFPILLGRKLLNNRFLVDTSYSHLPKKFMSKFTPTALNDEGGLDES